ncbi:MAG: outer membrane protein transport protein [Cyclobacteriaceae bacterium]|nr:outer membrane protein transport protein [Cyclobacteriaceae bacterium]
MKSWGNWLIGIALFFPILSLAQSTTETALLFSRTKPGGSARIQGMGGVQTSLGGDYSSAFSNPAGLGMFNRSEVSITPAFSITKNTSDYLNNSNTESASSFSVPGFGIIFQSDKDSRGGFLSGSFGISFNRTNNFKQKFSYIGRNDKNSIVDYFIQDANGLFPSDLKPGGDYFNTPTGLAYNNYLIEDSTFLNPNASEQDYLSVIGVFPTNPNDVRLVTQQELVTFEGAQNQWSFSYGANISDKVFLGAGLGLATIRFTSTKTYQESDYFFVLDPTFNPVDNMVLTEELRINGSGINGTFGMIVRPIDMVQIGISYATPTSYKLTDSYRATMNTKWNNFDYFGDNNPLNNVSEETDELISEYDLKTPGHLNFGATVFFQKSGFISADVEMVNYGGARYSSNISGINFDSDNERIDELYKNTFNYRIGGEYRLNNVRLRAGYNYMSEPFTSEQNGISRKITSYTTGIGYRTQKFFADFALVFSQGENSYRPYRINSPDSPLVLLNTKSTLGMLTIGFPF